MRYFNYFSSMDHRPFGPARPGSEGDFDNVQPKQNYANYGGSPHGARREGAYHNPTDPYYDATERHQASDTTLNAAIKHAPPWESKGYSMYYSYSADDVYNGGWSGEFQPMYAFYDLMLY